MKKLLIAALCVGFAAPVFADANDDAIQARRGFMRTMALNLGPLGAMAKGEADYNAGVAQRNATNLVWLTNVNVSNLFPAGTDHNAMPDKTNALPAIWSNMAGFGGKYNDLRAAASALRGSAGDGLDALKAAIGPVGKACGGCHETYRFKKN